MTRFRSSFAIVVTLVTVALAVPGFTSQSPSTATGTDRADTLYDEGSYRLAHEAYEKIDRSSLSEQEQKRLRFRLADSLWRSEIAGDMTDSTRLLEARRQLEELSQTYQGAVRDDLYAEIQESLGDSHWNRSMQIWSPAWRYYAEALRYWARSTDLDEARRHYLEIVRKAAESPQPQPWESIGRYAHSIPITILENAVEISRAPDDRAYMNFLLALRLSRTTEPRLAEQGMRAFEHAIEAGPGSAWYDDALFQYAQTLEQVGRLAYRNGSWQRLPDTAAALRLYRRITEEFSEGETRYYDDAIRRIGVITEPSLDLRVSNVFLPGSKVGYQIHWRNLASVDLELWQVDLTRDLEAGSMQMGDWLDRISFDGARRVDQTTRRLESEGLHLPGTETVKVARDLPVGAYLLRARSGDLESKELILVTDVSVVTKTSGRELLAWVTNATTGEPVANARVRAWEEYTDETGVIRFRTYGATTNEGGTATIDRVSSPRQWSRNLFVAVNRDGHQAWAHGYGASGSSDPREQWRIYAVTDRPAYRPEDTVQWKITARTWDGRSYSTPAGETVRYSIHDPRGNKIADGSLSLNEYGSAWSTLALEASMPLGLYTIHFQRENRGTIGSDTFFRLEEYKLPEYRVSVRPKDEDGTPRLYRLGDEIGIEIEAAYYFGGPVADATVQVVVYQRPYHHDWRWPRRYEWYFDEGRHPGRYMGGQEVVNETLTTGPDGRVSFTVDTPDAGADLEYTVQARVVDASRREIVGTATVRVSAQPFYAHLKPHGHLYRPGDEIDVELRTLDANEQPVRAHGEMVVTRETWKEVWLDPRGRRVTGPELANARASSATFPPPQHADEHPWRLIESGYEKEEVERSSFATDDDGEATYRFDTRREGFYRFTWTSSVDDDRTPRPRDIVTASTTVWVADRDTKSLGYHGTGIEMIVAEDSVREGTTTPVMIVTDSPGAHVLFTVERESILEHQIVSMRGDVALVQLDVHEQHIPNVFISASMVRDRQFRTETKELIVPPEKHFLDVEVSLDREAYESRERGTATITTRDHEGRPVSAEVTLGIADESVYYIQEDLSGDPRAEFYGNRVHNSVTTSSSFQFLQYVKLAENDEGDLVDERQLLAGRRETEEAGIAGGLAAGASRNLNLMSPAPPAAATAEAIQVTASAPQESRQSMAKFADEVADVDAVGGDAVVVRSDFRATALWEPHVVTGADGKASVELVWPDSLTTWKATARAATTGADFGIGETEAKTRKPLIVRLQAPRFFVVGDQTTISAIFNNNTDAPLNVDPKLAVEGLELIGSIVNGNRAALSSASMTVPANGERRLDWLVAARTDGTAKITVQGVSAEHSDAMERSYRVWEHGLEKLVASSGKVRGEASEIRFDLPAARRPGSTEMSVTVTPSIAITMLDALPYLIEYPYGCTEQTMSRFLPAAIVARTLDDLGISREKVASRVFGGIEPESIGKIHDADARDFQKLDAVVQKGLSRLYELQHDDGGWGWWKEGPSDHWMTAYVVWGLTLADQSRIAGVDAMRVQRAISWLDRELVEKELEPNRQAWMLHALTSARGSARNNQQRAFTNLWNRRDDLSPYGRALLAVSAHQMGKREEALVLVRNLENGVEYDASPDQSVVLGERARRTDDVMATAHWGGTRGWWRWYESPVETTSFVLRALVTIDPEHRLVEPAMNWLVKNRRGSQWNNTRDTAIAVLALTDHLKNTGELTGFTRYVVSVNGTEIGRTEISRSVLLTARSTFDVPTELIRDGRNVIRIDRPRPADGGDPSVNTQPLYFSVESRFFSTEEPVTAEGNEIFVRREYFRLEPRETLLTGFDYARVPLRDGESVRSGDRIDVVVTVETKNDYEYLIFEDLKPAGFEAVEVRSGERLYARQLRSDEVDERLGENSSMEARGRVIMPPGSTGRSQWVHQELRDRKVVMFADRLEQGVWEIRYSLRAEVPGSFHALPLIGEAMYVPEIRANSEEVRVGVEER